jgi:hypothetical protein
MNNSSLFSGTTDSNLDLGALLFLAIALLILLYHEVRTFMIKDEKEKYDYVNTHEIRYFWYAVMALIVSAALYLNRVVIPLFSVEPDLRIYIRVFFLAGFLVIAYLLLSGMVRVLYPRVIEHKLNRIRNKPRISPSGNVMRKLSEAEEAVHLDKAQIDEQASEIHSAEYDVWVDEKTGFKKVEKYMAFQHAAKCQECGFYTMKIHTEEVEKKPTTTEDGLLIEHYRCSYCKHREAKEVVIAKLSTNA